MELNDHAKGCIDELTVAEKNRILEEEVKTLTLKLKNTEGQIENLQAKIREFEEEGKNILKFGMNGTDDAQSDVLDLSKTRDLEEENKSLRLEHLELTVKYQMQTMLKIINLKLENPEGQVDELHAKISDPEEVVKILMCEMNSGLKNLSKSFRTPDLRKENESLKLDLLEFTVKYHMREMWEMINLELKGHSLPSKQPKQRILVCNSDLRRGQLISTVTSENETNPLKNEEIVRHIMGYVNPKDLLQCRQVCKLWRKAAQKDFEGRVTFHVKTQRGFFQIPLFMECAAKSFPTFRILKFELNCKSWAANKKDVSALFVKHGKQLHKLKLDFGGNGFHGEIWNMDDLRDVFLNSLEEIRELHIYMSCRLIHHDQMFLSHHVKKPLMNLTILNIGLNCGSCPYLHHENTQVFIDFLRLIPNLKVLHWGSWGMHGVHGSINFIHSLLHVMPIKLEKLFILSIIPDFLVSAIAFSQFKLNQLDFYDVQSFKLQLISSAYGRSEVLPRITPYFSGTLNPTLKIELENVLALPLYRNVSCTQLVQVFLNALAAAIQRGLVRINERTWAGWAEDELV